MEFEADRMNLLAQLRPGLLVLLVLEDGLERSGRLF
jgi:hypothetical protein